MKKIFLLPLLCVLIISLSIISPLTANAKTLDVNSNTCSQETNVNCSYENASAESRSSGSGGEEVDGEDWYNIASDGETPCLPHAVDYSTFPELLSYLKPGDLLFERNGESVGDIFHHIAIVVGVVWDETYQQEYVLLIESVSEGVKYGLLTPTRFTEKEGILLRLTDATDEQKQSAVLWAEEELNSGYSFDPTIVTKNPNHSNTTWYCSELAWAAYYWQGIYLDQDDNLSSGGSIVYPDEIYEYANATTILHSDYATTLVATNDTYHTYTCDGDIYDETHTYEAYNSCYEKCSICNHSRQANAHSYTNRYVYVNSTGHRAYCSCGATVTEAHAFEQLENFKICYDCGYKVNTSSHVHSYIYTSCGDGLRHNKTCACGISTKELCIGTSMAGGISICVHCGQSLNGLLSIDTDLSTEAILPVTKEELLE